MTEGSGFSLELVPAQAGAGMTFILILGSRWSLCPRSLCLRRHKLQQESRVLPPSFPCKRESRDIWIGIILVLVSCFRRDDGGEWIPASAGRTFFGLIIFDNSDNISI